MAKKHSGVFTKYVTKLCKYCDRHCGCFLKFGYTKDGSTTTTTTETRKQFFAPLTACVTNMSHHHHHHPDDYHYHLTNHAPHHHHSDSLTGSTEGSEYTLDDIEEALSNEDGGGKTSTPDVLAGTPASESGDELVNFVQQDQNRIERIKKKYETDQSQQKNQQSSVVTTPPRIASATEEDDENDDYGFNHRPSVRGIKPRFGSTTEILQQIQNQIQAPVAVAANAANANNTSQWTAYYASGEETKQQNGGYGSVRQYRPTSLHDNYQNCASQTCFKEIYKTQSFIELDCNDYHHLQQQQQQPVPVRLRNGGSSGRAMSPPPQEISKNYHQTMVYIPYNHIDGYHPAAAAAAAAAVAYQSNEYYRYNQNQINKKYIDTIYHHKLTTHMEEQYCNSNIPAMQKMPAKGPYSNYQHLTPSSRSESPLFGNYDTARSTQASVGCPPSCNIYSAPPATLRYRTPQWKSAADYGTIGCSKTTVNRHSYPLTARPKYPTDMSTTDPSLCGVDTTGTGKAPVDTQRAHHAFNGYYNYGMVNSPADSPTKSRYIERGVPEGAASVSPQDSVVTASSSSVATSPTVPHGNMGPTKPLFYAMNV